MSALWIAEVESTMRLVAADAAARQAAEKAGIAERAAAAIRRAAAKSTRIKGGSRAAVLKFLRAQTNPVTYYWVAKHTHMSNHAAQHRLRELVKDGAVRVIHAPHGRTKYMMEKGHE